MGSSSATHEYSLRICSMCGDSKPVTYFSYRDKSRGLLQSRCKSCCSTTFKSYRQANLDKFREYKWYAKPENKAIKAEYQRQRKLEMPERVFQTKRNSYLKSKFGITPEQYEAMLAAQNGVCAICSSSEPGRNSPYFHVDHCHDTGNIRGLLCNGCNVGLGHFKDDISRIESAAAYLKVWK